MSDQPTAQAIQASQGTRLSDVPPWMSYAAEFDEQLDPKLQAEMEHYSQQSHKSTSSQNKEELHRQTELNEGVAKQYQWLHPSEYKEEGPRIGSVMHSDEFMGKLRSCTKNTRFWYRDHPQPRKLTMLYHKDGMPQPEVACWVQAGYMPEYSFMRFDRYGVPLDERRRGWRTCLLQMILKGIVSEAKAHKVFSRATGPASDRYNSTLFEWRKQERSID